MSFLQKNLLLYQANILQSRTLNLGLALVKNPFFPKNHHYQKEVSVPPFQPSARQKTKEQKGREYEHLKKIEEIRAKERQVLSGGDKKSEDYQESVMENFPQLKTLNPPARDIAASKLGMSGKTAEKVAAVVEAILSRFVIDKNLIPVIFFQLFDRV
ncbi:MAG: hypothetical protein HQK62_05820 [Desulfamplus sp.]|nr:hypothetical protein [Desulfamplus sp.]